MIKWIKENIQRGKEWIIEQVLWAERTLKGKSGAEKRAAVVQKLDDMVVLPIWLEPFDGPIFGVCVDLACSMLNDMYGHIWPGKWEETDISKTAATLPDPEEVKESGGDNAGIEAD